MTPDRFVSLLRRHRAVAVLRTDMREAAGPAMAAAVRGGFGIVEFTWNTPGAPDRIEELSSAGSVCVGAGTILCPEDAREAVRHGAAFLVSPVADPAVLEEARRLGVCLIPGCQTPGELLEAHRLGAPVQKLFPAPAGGPEWVRTVLAPLPFFRLMPTSGVDASNAAAYLEAGCIAVGFVGSLFESDALRAGAFDRVEARARTLLGALV